MVEISAMTYMEMPEPMHCINKIQLMVPGVIYMVAMGTIFS